MMSKEEHIQYWLKTAEEDFEVLIYLYKGNKYVHTLFFGHLYLEKISKALWIKNNQENIPPRIHNLLTLLEQAKINLEDDQKIFLLKMNLYQIEGRYPENIDKLRKVTDRNLTEKYLEQINLISKCLQEHLL